MKNVGFFVYLFFVLNCVFCEKVPSGGEYDKAVAKTRDEGITAWYKDEEQNCYTAVACGFCTAKGGDSKVAPLSVTVAISIFDDHALICTEIDGQFIDMTGSWYVYCFYENGESAEFKVDKGLSLQDAVALGGESNAKLVDLLVNGHVLMLGLHSGEGESYKRIWLTLDGMNLKDAT